MTLPKKISSKLVVFVFVYYAGKREGERCGEFSSSSSNGFPKKNFAGECEKGFWCDMNPMIPYEAGRCKKCNDVIIIIIEIIACFNKILLCRSVERVLLVQLGDIP